MNLTRFPAAEQTIAAVSRTIDCSLRSLYLIRLQLNGGVGQQQTWYNRKETTVHRSLGRHLSSQAHTVPSLSSISLCILAISVGTGCSSSPSSRDSDSKDTIAAGISEQLNTILIPDGPIQIVYGLSAQIEGSSFRTRRFSTQYLESLRRWEQKGLLSIRPVNQSTLETIGQMGAQTVVVVPAETLRKAADSARSKNGYLAISAGSVRIEEIVRDTAYSSPQLSSSEQYRLVLGTYRLTPSPITVFDSTDVVKSYRFKALLKLDPFAKRYSFVAVDWGAIGTSEWETHRVP